MSEFAWSLLLDGFGLIPITLTAYKRREAYIFSWILMGMWIIYAFDKGGYGFIPGALIYSVFYYFAWRKWGNKKYGLSAKIAAAMNHEFYKQRLRDRMRLNIEVHAHMTYHVRWRSWGCPGCARIREFAGLPAVTP